MDGWMHGWMNGWIDGWMDGWMEGWMFVCVRMCVYVYFTLFLSYPNDCVKTSHVAPLLIVLVFLTIPARTPTPSKSLAIESLHKSIIFHGDIGFRVGELAFPLGRCCKPKKTSILIGNYSHFFRTCVFRLGCCKSKKSIEWLHQQRHIFSTYAPTAVGASILSSKVGPE